MEKKTFYLILFIGLGAISIYTLLDIFILPETSRGIETGTFQFFLALFIIGNQTIEAKKIFLVVNFIVSPVFVAGILFTIQHWPYGRIMLMLSSGTIIVSLFINHLLSPYEKALSIVLLLFPMIMLLTILTPAFHLQIQQLLWNLNLFTMILISVLLGINLATKKRLGKGDESIDDPELFN